MAYFLRYVNIKDRGLDILSWFCWIIYTGIFIFLTLYLRFWTSDNPIEHDMFMHVSSNSVDDFHVQALKDGWNQGLQSNLVCKTPSLFYYWYDESGNNAFDDFSCASLCDNGELHADCISRHQLIENPESRELTIITYVEDMTYNASSSSVRKRVLPWNPREMKINLEFFIHEQGDGFFSSLGIGGQKTKMFSSSENIITVIRDPKGNIVRSIGPGVIEVTVEEMLRLSVETSSRSLDNPELGDSTNRHPTATLKDGPIPRLAGADMGIQLVCHNYQPHDSVDLWQKHGKYPVCTVRFHYNGNLVGYNKVVAVDANGMVANRRYRGVRISIEAFGHFVFFSFYRLMAMLALYILFSAVPTFLMLFIVTQLLGSYSSIYSRAVINKFNIFDYSRGLVARLMISYLSFDQFADKHTDTLSKEVLAARIAASIVHYSNMKDRDQEIKGRIMETMDAQNDKMGKLKALVDLCYHAFLSKPPPRSFVRLLKAIMKPECSLDWELSDPGIGRQAFMNGCLETEILKFEDLAMIFDSERKLGLLERIFAPLKVRQFREYARDHLKEETPRILYYFRRCFSDHSHEVVTMVSYDEVWNIPRTRVEKLMGRLRKLDNEVTEIRNLKPPIVITLPKTPSMENKQVIQVELDASSGGNLGFEVISVQEASGLDVAEVSEIFDDGLLAHWNRANPDSTIGIGDRIYLLNDDLKQFDVVKAELARPDLHYIAFEASEPSQRQKLNSEFAPNMAPHLESSEEALRNTEDERLELQRARESHERELNAIDVAGPVGQAESLIAQFNELGTMLDFSQDELHIFRSRVCRDQSCYKCGKENLSGNICECGFDITTPPMEYTIELRRPDDEKVLVLEYRTLQKPKDDAEPLEAIIEVHEEPEETPPAMAITESPEHKQPRKPTKPTFADYESQYFHRLYGQSLLDAPGHSSV